MSACCGGDSNETRVAPEQDEDVSAHENILIQEKRPRCYSVTP